MSNILQMRDRRERTPIVETVRDRCINIFDDLEMLAQQLDHALGQHLDGEAGKRHRQHCEILANMLREARTRVEKI